MLVESQNSALTAVIWLFKKHFSFRLLGDYLLVLLSQLQHIQNPDHIILVISSKISFEGLVVEIPIG